MSNVLDTVDLNRKGQATLSRAVLNAAFYRVRFLGEPDLTEAVSNELHVLVYTRLTITRTRTGLRATLATGADAVVPGAKLALQRRAATSGAVRLT